MAINDKTSSFSLIRTNPRLTGNVKISVDSAGKLWLNSIDANKNLSDSKYKRFRIGNGSSYEMDLHRFLKGVPSEVLFEVKQNTALENAAKTYDKQYDFFYNAGAEMLISNQYAEAYSYFAPLWLRDQIPSYFVIFRIDDPLDYPYNDNVTTAINGKKYKIIGDDATFTVRYDGTTYTDGDILTAIVASDFTVLTGTGKVVDLDENKDLPIASSDRFQKILEKSQIIKTFDLTENTTAGRYIRGIRNNPKFPRSPMTARYDTGLMTTWNGISYAEGIITSKGELLEKYWSDGQSLIDFEDYITGGFQRHGIISMQMLNMEFLFDDPTADNYTIPRYYGMYVDALPVGSFQLDGDALFEHRSDVDGNTPVPKRNNRGFRHQDEELFQNNEAGVRLYIMNPAGLVPSSDDVKAATNRLWWIQDKAGNFHSLDQATAVYDGSVGGADDLVVRNKSLDLGALGGAGKVKLQAKGSLLPLPGKSHMILKLSDTLLPNDEIRVYWHGGSITDLYGKYDIILANDLTGTIDGWGPGSSYQNLYFHPYGTVDQVCTAIAGALNNIADRNFDVVGFDGKVVIRFRAGEDVYNTSSFCRFNISAAVMTANDVDVVPFSGALHYFIGGTDLAKIRLRVPAEDLAILADGEVWLKTRLGLSKVVYVGRYVDEAVAELGGSDIASFGHYDDYGVIHIENALDEIYLGSMNEFVAYSLYNVPVGMFSFYNVKELDGDFWSSSYGRSPTHEYHRYFDMVADQDSLIEGRKYIVFTDDTSPDGAILYDGNVIIGSALGTVFTATTTLQFSVDSGTPFVVPMIFYSHAYPGQINVLEPGQTYEVVGDPSDPMNTVWYTSHNTPLNFSPSNTPIDSIPADPADWADPTYLQEYHNGEMFITDSFLYYMANHTGTSSDPVVRNTRFFVDEDLQRFQGFYTLHDFVTVDSEQISVDSKEFQHKDRFFQHALDTEYDYLKENFTKELALKSRLFPSILKWAYSGGNDVRDNPYRLNTLNVFGTLNFSPSFNVTSQSPEAFTHEWYYLERSPQNYPEIFKKDNYYFFDDVLEEDKLINPLLDGYFESYFTYQPAEHTPVQERYSMVEFNKETGICETFFRGIKIRIKEVVRETKIEQLQSNKPPFKNNSTRFDGYKFTSLLRVHKAERCLVESPLTVKFVENVDQKTITMLIDIILDDYRTLQLVSPDDVSIRVLASYLACSSSGSITGGTGGGPVLLPAASAFIRPLNDYPDQLDWTAVDYTLLYSMKSKKAEALYDPGWQTVAISDPAGSSPIDPAYGSDSHIIGDFKLSSALNYSGPSGPYGLGYSIDTIANPYYDTDLREEIRTFTRINRTTGSYLYGTTSTDFPIGVTQTNILFGTPGADIVEYGENYAVHYNTAGNIVLNTVIPQYYLYMVATSVGSINIVPPSGAPYLWEDLPTTVLYGGADVYEPIMYRASFARIAQRVNEYSDLIKYNTYRTGQTGATDNEFYLEFIEPSTVTKKQAMIPHIDDQRPEELNGDTIVGVNLKSISIDGDIMRYSGPYEPKFRPIIFFKDQKTDYLKTIDLSFQQVTFDPATEWFGIARNLGLLKVSQDEILDLRNNTKYKSLYPLVHEISLDRRDLSVFQSSWDPGFWQAYINKSLYSPQAGTRSMLEVKNFFATKLMKVPDSIRIETATTEEVADITIGIDGSTAEILYQVTPTKILGLVNIEKRLLRQLIEDGADAEFVKYLMPEFGTGDPEDLSDDVLEYLKLNVLPAFQVSNIDLYLYKYKDGVIQAVRGDMTDAEKLTGGYRKNKNFTTQKWDTFVYYFEYNIDPSFSVSLAPAFDITRI